MRASWLVLLGVVACGSSKEQGAERQPASASTSEREGVVRVARVSASSAHAASAGYTFIATNLIDGALNTSWQPASSERGSEKWVRLEFDEDVTITSVAIANGFQTKDRYGDEFLLNRRIATGRLRFGNSDEVPIQFAADARGYVRFVIPKKTTRTIELVIDETHSGTKWNDLAISEIEVTGSVKRVRSEAGAASSPAGDQWWTPPGGDRKVIEALAYGFAGIDEKDLGTMFTSDLKPVYGAPNLFEERPPRRVARDGMQKLVMKLRDSAQFDAGFRFFFINVGGNYKSDRDYQVVRAMQVKEVVRVDESARMRRPPENAIFYLAEVHLGASFDLLVDGSHRAMGAQLEFLFAKGDGAAKHVRESSSYRLKAFGLGLRDVSGDGIFAMTPQEIGDRYRTGAPVPVQLVFRSIPGRNYKPKEYPVPLAIIDEPMFSVRESASRSWAVPAGRYWIEASSNPYGLKLTWSGGVTCDQQMKNTIEYTTVKMNCTVVDRAQLTLTNPSAWNSGPEEVMSLYVSRDR